MAEWKRFYQRSRQALRGILSRAPVESAAEDAAGERRAQMGAQETAPERPYPNNIARSFPRSLKSDTLRRLGRWALRQIAALHPDCFAFVMATGIISNALYLEGHPVLSGLLFLINTLAYLWLAGLTVARCLLFPRAVWLDLINPERVFAFFTLVAANGVFGAGAYLRGATAAALDLWLLAGFTWFMLIYLSFGILAFRNTPERADVVHGGWLLAIVGTESLVILGALVASSTGDFAAAVFVFIHMLWGVGIALYAVLVTLLAYRIFFFAITPRDLTPFLWVVMGAAAISTNAGSVLLLTDSGMPSLIATRPFIEGATLILWAWASWWIPLLLLFGIWKHAVHRVPLTYTPMLWGIVFPLGMHALASLRLSLAADFAPLRGVSAGMLWIAVAAWAAAFAGLAVATWNSLRKFAG